MKLPLEIKSELPTPCVIVDILQTRQNIADMQYQCDRAGCHLRPHIKTHKMKELALMQLKAGARGISCAKLSEAEVMAECGIEDIFVAYPIIGKARLHKALVLNKQIKRLILGVDSLIQAKHLSLLGQQHDQCFEIRLEINSGANRSGASLQNVISLATAINQLKNIKLTGIYTFKSLIYQGTETQDAQLAACEEAQIMIEVKAQLKKIGITPLEISAGSTPTVKELLNYQEIDEVRPGTYIFHDQMLVHQKVCSKEQISAYVCATVVSIHEDGTLIIDGGSKAFCTDIRLEVEPYDYQGYAICEDHNYVLSKLNEEHGYLYCIGQKGNYKVGDQLLFSPIHICTTINLYNSVYFYDGHKIIEKCVDARGMLV